MELNWTPTDLDYIQWYEDKPTKEKLRCDINIPWFTYMGAHTRSWVDFKALEEDALVREYTADDREWIYWPVRQRSTEWMWLTGKTAETFGTAADTAPIKLTASQIPALMGLDPNCTRKNIWRLKKNPKLMDKPKSEMAQMILNWGTEHEHDARTQFMTILKSYNENDPEDTRLLRYVYEAGTFQHGKHTWMAASPDGFFTELPYVDHNEALNNMTCALEIKCPWKQILPDVVPVHHMVQMQVS